MQKKLNLKLLLLIALLGLFFIDQTCIAQNNTSNVWIADNWRWNIHQPHFTCLTIPTRMWFG